MTPNPQGFSYERKFTSTNPSPHTVIAAASCTQGCSWPTSNPLGAPTAATLSAPAQTNEFSER
jgi:hypothetical protein